VSATAQRMRLPVVISVLTLALLAAPFIGLIMVTHWLDFGFVDGDAAR
jgi:molybdate/tungstate transport system permease protein